MKGRAFFGLRQDDQTVTDSVARLFNSNVHVVSPPALLSLLSSAPSHSLAPHTRSLSPSKHAVLRRLRRPRRPRSGRLRDPLRECLIRRQVRSWAGLTVYARVQITAPINSTTWTAGQEQLIQWQDNPGAPSVKDFGPSMVSLYVGNQIQQASISSKFLLASLSP